MDHKKRFEKWFARGVQRFGVWDCQSVSGWALELAYPLASGSEGGKICPRGRVVPYLSVLTLK
jgi:hypothetical protein